MSALQKLIDQKRKNNTARDIAMANEAAAELAAMNELLRELEWAGSDDWGSCCPICGNYRAKGKIHDDDCALNSVLRGLE